MTFASVSCVALDAGDAKSVQADVGEQSGVVPFETRWISYLDSPAGALAAPQAALQVTISAFTSDFV